MANLPPVLDRLVLASLRYRRAPLALGAVGLASLLAGRLPAAEPTAWTFADRAAQWGLDFTHFNGMSGEYYLLEITGAGGALLDYDNDGDLDVYLVQGHMLPPGRDLSEAIFPPRQQPPFSDRLYRNDMVIGPTGESTIRFVDVTEASGIEALGYGMGVTSGDYDNDGNIDLYLSNYGSNQMLHNNGDGTFSDTTNTTGTDDRRWSVPASFFDFDRDGWLDLYVGNYVRFDFSLHFECPNVLGVPGYCGPLSYTSQGDTLFRNRGDGTFEDVTQQAGLGTDHGNALGSVVADFNADGWLDLYVANDQVPNALWINAGDGTFRNEALLAGCAVNRQGQPEASMGVDAADFDNDGDEDLFMGHLSEETNTLYLNDGKGLFSDATDLAGLGNPSWSYTTFGTVWLDIDLDGLLDVFAVNGAVLLIAELVRLEDPFPLHQPNQVFRNLGNARFDEVTDQMGDVLGLSEVSRGAVAGDVDLDGDLDLLVTNNSGPVRLLVNELSTEPAWLGVRIVAESGRDELGATATISTGNRAHMRRVRTDGSFASARDPRLSFGLGDTETIDAVDVQSLTGSRIRLHGISLNTNLSIVTKRRTTAR